MKKWSERFYCLYTENWLVKVGVSLTGLLLLFALASVLGWTNSVYNGQRFYFALTTIGTLLMPAISEIVTWIYYCKIRDDYSESAIGQSFQCQVQLREVAEFEGSCQLRPFWPLQFASFMGLYREYITIRSEEEESDTDNPLNAALEMVYIAREILPVMPVITLAFLELLVLFVFAFC